jgi:hypothetical protein
MHLGKSIESGEKSRLADSLISQTVQAPDNALSLHISPCGDWWLGTEIYAAKHNPSGYVRSIKLPDGFDEHDHSLDGLPESMFKAMYDTGFLDVCISMPKLVEDKDMLDKSASPSEIG